MQVTKEDIEGVARCLSAMHDGATIFIDYRAELYGDRFETHWRVCSVKERIVIRKATGDFPTWEQLVAWVHGLDTDNHESIMIKEGE
jgi:hypothetical protein